MGRKRPPRTAPPWARPHATFAWPPAARISRASSGLSFSGEPSLTPRFRRRRPQHVCSLPPQSTVVSFPIGSPIKIIIIIMKISGWRLLWEVGDVSNRTGGWLLASMSSHSAPANGQGARWPSLEISLSLFLSSCHCFPEICSWHK